MYEIKESVYISHVDLTTSKGNDMNTAQEKKTAIVNKDEKSAVPSNQSAVSNSLNEAQNTKVPTESLRDQLAKLDAERAAMAKNAIENLKPGKAFDTSVVREINKVETRKNRLIVSRFASLLRKGGPEIQTLVYQLVEL